MRTFYLYLAVFIFLGCGSRDHTKHQSNFFPLNVGNEWMLSTGINKLQIHITNIIQKGKSRIYEVEEQSLSDQPPAIVRKRFYSFDSLGNIQRNVLFPDSIIVSLWYKLNALANESWDAKSNSEFTSREIHPYRITLESRTDTVITPEGTYHNCLRFLIDDIQESDTEYWEWLADGIGIVKRTYLNKSAKGFELAAHKIVQ